MRGLRAPVTAVFLVVCGVASMAQAAGTPSPATVAVQRQQALDDILRTDTAYTVAADRQICAGGRMPAFITEKRAAGAAFYPDAIDMCVAALMRTARDNHLPELYVKLLGETGGDRSQAEGLPQAIGGAALANQKAAPIGNGKGMVITPALAFDAGFAAATRDRAATAPAADPRQLRALAESCLGQQQNPGPCFSAGYVYGVQSAQGRVSFAH